MKNKKRIARLLTTTFLITTLINPVIVKASDGVVVQNEPAVSDSFETRAVDTVYRYMVLEGNLYKRLWDNFNACWIDPYWIYVGPI